MKTLLLLTFFCLTASAAECPWLSYTGAELLPFDSDLSVDKSLTEAQVEADLNCLKLLFQNYYVAQRIYGEDKLISRLNLEISHKSPLTSKQLMEKIFSLHEGMIDFHLNYSLGDQQLRFPSSGRSVEVSEDLDPETLYTRKNAIYFRPGSLMAVSAPQQAFIKLVAKTDQNIILDLRGNSGGDDQFAYDLTEALFTKDQKIPSTKRFQVDSPLQRIGLSLSLLILEHPKAESYRSAVRQEVERLPFKSLLPYQLVENVERLEGRRVKPFTSQIILLVDGGCASSCETIVEKISKHPRAKVIGQNTMGALHFSNPMTFMLPYSGIVVRLPTLLHAYENDAPEGVGYSPNVRQPFVDLDSLFD